MMVVIYYSKDCYAYKYQYKSDSKYNLKILRLNNHINDHTPKNQNQVYQELLNKIKLITLASYTASAMYDTIQLKEGLYNNNHIANAGFVGEYIDKNNKFSLVLPPGIYYTTSVI